MKQKIKDTLRQSLLFTLLVIVSWSYFWLPDYQKKQRMLKKTAQLRAEIEMLHKRIDYNRERIALLKNDPVTIESEIRRNLRWVRPGELPADTIHE